jgi:hypothetical protein
MNRRLERDYCFGLLGLARAPATVRTRSQAVDVLDSAMARERRCPCMDLARRRAKQKSSGDAALNPAGRMPHYTDGTIQRDRIRTAPRTRRGDSRFARSMSHEGPSSRLAASGATTRSVRIAYAQTTKPIHDRRSLEGMRPPLWLQWVLSIVVAVAVIVALVRFVQSSTANQITTENAAGAAQANREAEILVAEDQAPHTVRLTVHTAAAVAINRAIRADMTTMIDEGSLDGPLQRSSCAPTGPPGKAGESFGCTVSAAGVSYPFVGVVDARARTIVFCKRDPPPDPLENIPVSSRCTA